MLSQQPRPEHEYRQCLPKPTAVSFNPDIEAALSQLCAACTEIQTWLRANLGAIREASVLADRNRYNTEQTFHHYEKGYQLHRSSENGCHLCTIIWENMVDRDSIAVFDDDHWTCQKEQLTNDIEKGQNLVIRLYVPSSIYKGRGGISDDPKHLAFAAMRASIQTTETHRDETEETSNLIMLCATQAMKEVNGFWRREHAGDALTPFTYTRQSNHLDQLSYLPKHKHVDVAKAMEQLDQNVGPRLFFPTVPLYTGSSRCLGIAKEWASTCYQTHTKCKATQSSEPPTRLLDVSLQDQPNSIRLVETVGPPEGVVKPYAALSYCWGKQQAFRLLTTNIDVIRKGLAISLLPQTIQDAILVARHLDLQYLWVDALCIIQDSQQDWQKEATRMCDVYQNCFVSLAAKGASSSADGMFSLRDPVRHTPCLLFTTERDCVFVSSPYVSTRSQSRSAWALDRRGWVVQERLLPPRTLSFGSSLSWECRHSNRDEFDLEPVANFDKLMVNFFTRVTGNLADLSADQEKSILSIWWSILSEYSQTFLTFPSDRYAALMGIIQAIKRKTGWAEVAGIWVPHAADSLLWGAIVGATRNIQRTGLSSSWSRISLNCKVNNFRKEEKDEMLVIVNEEKLAEY